MKIKKTAKPFANKKTFRAGPIKTNDKLVEPKEKLRAAMAKLSGK